MPLPVITTTQDVRDIVSYLRNKATGATIAEAQAVVKKQVLDARKLSSYTFWGLVDRDADRLSLSARGWELARSKDDGAVFQTVLAGIAPYRSALEWLYYQNFESATNVDVAAHWHEHHSVALGTSNENSIKDSAVCFFHICEAAGLGKLTLGRRGNPTRLTLNRAELGRFVEVKSALAPDEPSARTPNGQTSESVVEQAAGAEVPHAVSAERQSAPPVTRQLDPPVTSTLQKLRVFISHSGGMEMVDQVQTMLGLAEMEGEVAEEEETTAIPVPEKVLSAMRRCQAGIIVVSVDDRRTGSNGSYTLNSNVLIEIGAAFVLYDRRVVLVWDRRLPVPSNLQGLYRCEYEGDELSWAAGMKLMKAIQGFKGQASLTR